MIEERFATAESNWRIYETFKTALGHGIVHAPEHALARAELENLLCIRGRVDHPETGDVRTKDVSDAMAHTTFNLIGDDATALFERLAETGLSGSQPGPSNPDPEPPPDPRDRLSAFGRSHVRGPGNPSGGGRPNFGNRPNDYRRRGWGW